jgi:cyclohexa-1,5-dienecarbonyl-CoA hydratase
MSVTAHASGTVQATTAAGVRRIVLARPPLNVLTTAMLLELAAAFEAVRADEECRVVLLTGAGERAFCAGVDVADHTPDRVDAMMQAFARAVAAILATEVPVVAALNGAALGGGLEVALACDIVLARDGAVLGQPEIRLGVFPPVAAALLPRRIGRQAALDLILTGRTVTATDARALGLITLSYPAEVFAAEAAAYAAELAAHSGPVLKLAKRAVDAGTDRPLADALHDADRLYLDELMTLHDPHEGLTAFMEKRVPVWRNA